MPRTDLLLADPRLAEAERRLGRALVKAAVSRAQQRARDGQIAPEEVAEAAVAELPARASALTPVLNATGVLVHTNLGRAPLSAAAADAIVAAAGNCDVEFDLASGTRARRGAGALDVAVARGRHDRVHRGGGQRRAAQVGVHQHPGRVDHRGHGRGPGGQFGHGRVGDLLRGDLPVPRPLLGAAHRRLDQGAAERAFGLYQAGIGQQQIRARHAPPFVHVANDTRAAPEYRVLRRVGAGR